MDNNQLDQKFKKYFDTRKIEPSDKSWDRLDAMLNITEKPVISSRFPFYLVAASMITILAVGFYWMFNNDENSKLNPVMVEVSKETKLPAVLELKNTAIENIESKASNTPPVYARPYIASYTAKITPDQSEMINQKVNIKPTDQNVIDHTLAHVVAEAKDLQKNQQSVLDIDGMKLLNEIESRMSANKKHKENSVVQLTYRPDPAALLKEAESAAHQGLFKRVYKSLHENAENLLVNVVNRNNYKSESSN